MNGHQLVLHKIKESKLTAALVRRIFNYDPKTGWLTWAMDSRNVKGKGKGGNRRQDKRAGFAYQIVARNGRKNGYRRVQLGKHLYAEHRLIWLHVYGQLPAWPQVIDHVNGDGTDNRLSNLREASPAQNVQNTQRRKRSRTIWRTKDRWTVRLTIGGFKTRKEAATFAYTTMKQFHGEFVNPEHYGL